MLSTTVPLFAGLLTDSAEHSVLILARSHQSEANNRDMPDTVLEEETQLLEDIWSLLSTMSSPVAFFIPDTLRSWPWPRRLNPYYDICKAESSSWCESFKAFSPKAQNAFNRCNFNLLASLAFPRLNKDGCRVGCDLMNLFFVFDEYSDVATENGAREQADIIMDALRNPHKTRSAKEWIGGEITRQFWENAVKTATVTAQRRFIDTFQLYTDSVVQQAQDRDHHLIRDIKSYFEVRRDTIGAKPSFAILEIHMNLPDKVLQDTVIQRLTAACIDMLIIGNDLCSYNVEQARGDDGHNLVTIAKHELKTDLDGSLKWISKLHDNLADQFLADFANVPSFGDRDLDAQVATYVDGLGNWVRANDSWSFESQRYFGKKGTEIEESRWVTLLPKVKRQTGLYQLFMSSLWRLLGYFMYPKA